MLRSADRMGLLVWSENPVYWALQFDNPKVLAKAEQQLDEEINTSRNHAAIILWSMANETPNTAARTQFITTLATRARGLDPTRLITAALLVRAKENTKIVDDPLGQALDVIGMNEYIGWYEGHPESADITQWQIEYQKPVIVSEFGADAKAGLHGGENERWTEEYQANVFRHQLPMLNQIPQLRGMSPWILMDFRSRIGLSSAFRMSSIAKDYLRSGPEESRHSTFSKRPITTSPSESPIKCVKFTHVTHNSIAAHIPAMLYPLSMSIESILAEIDAEIARLTQVRSLLAGSRAVVSSGSKRRPAKRRQEKEART